MPIWLWGGFWHIRGCSSAWLGIVWPKGNSAGVQLPGMFSTNIKIRCSESACAKRTSCRTRGSQSSGRRLHCAHIKSCLRLPQRWAWAIGYRVGQVAFYTPEPIQPSFISLFTDPKYITYLFIYVLYNSIWELAFFAGSTVDLCNTWGLQHWVT